MQRTRQSDQLNCVAYTVLAAARHLSAVMGAC